MTLIEHFAVRVDKIFQLEYIKWCWHQYRLACESPAKIRHELEYCFSECSLSFQDNILAKLRIPACWLPYCFADVENGTYDWVELLGALPRVKKLIIIHQSKKYRKANLALSSGSLISIPITLTTLPTTRGLLCQTTKLHLSNARQMETSQS